MAATTLPGGLELAYEVHGCGPPVLLVAGTGYPGATWPPRALAVLAEGFSVITYDHRGTGRSSAPAGPYSTRMLAADALGLLAAIDAGPAHVVGHSMGGRVAQWMAVDGPDRVATLVLAASGAGARPDSGHVRRGIPVATVIGLMELGYEGFVRRQQRQTFFTEQFAAAHPDVVEWLATAFWEQRPELSPYLEHVAARQEHDTNDVLAAIRQPTLVVVGDRDTHAGGTGSHLEQSRYLAECIPGAESVVLPGVAHGFFWQEPEPSTGVVRDWLAAQTRSAA